MYFILHCVFLINGNKEKSTGISKLCQYSLGRSSCFQGDMQQQQQLNPILLERLGVDKISKILGVAEQTVAAV